MKECPRCKRAYSWEPYHYQSGVISDQTGRPPVFITLISRRRYQFHVGIFDSHKEIELCGKECYIQQANDDADSLFGISGERPALCIECRQREALPDLTLCLECAENNEAENEAQAGRGIISRTTTSYEDYQV